MDRIFDHCNTCCLLKSLHRTIKECRVYIGKKDAANQIDFILKTKLSHSPFDNDKSVNSHDGHAPDYLIFSGIKDPRVCALIAMLVGCDACPKGVEGTGLKVEKELIDKHCNLSGSELHDALAEAISMMKGAIVRDKDSVLCLACQVNTL